MKFRFTPIFILFRPYKNRSICKDLWPSLNITKDETLGLFLTKVYSLSVPGFSFRYLRWSVSPKDHWQRSNPHERSCSTGRGNLSLMKTFWFRGTMKSVVQKRPKILESERPPGICSTKGKDTGVNVHREKGWELIWTQITRRRDSLLVRHPFLRSRHQWRTLSLDRGGEWPTHWNPFNEYEMDGVE